MCESVADRLYPAAVTARTALLVGAARTSGQLHEAPWLILPVVICLSQRLSHACLSACRYLDNCGNSRANTCKTESRPVMEGTLLLDQNQSVAGGFRPSTVYFGDSE
ncbi:hypothetical protein ALC62_00579 [Cyphomyrmex costatus]|uniref:Uncharacterized protein n=1 Tax=Cyphomyrmex costatus TaxID=456900 RepID=A0A151IQK8_9HYME|nr:hypothetical protein ALC62_00579 [Cyphomyrmex costatus]